ncbi:hypothetical protein C5167_032232 [Papaver somniferum]|uniref:Initiator tRNA phosphoribosyl transferase family protein n=1 Tax=Papaver somniferum TaxID=3469 RepID=A0A4Y7K864_PAPSO|nr:tRNA A64-2'-O-ribosylphosphate transferase isoform X1 [Papaver somniferum]RZC68550.1 hypothetical protein C5167_032232 [Papaver somniferum]
MEEPRMNIYRISRSIKKKENSLYNALKSIYEDSIFVGEISEIWSQLPLVANLRCGLWYSRQFHSTCYFKSTDGHCNNWSFNTSRLNLHIAHLAGQKGGCIIVDSTRKGKRFPDSMAKTIPIWTCVLNRAIRNNLKNDRSTDDSESNSSVGANVDRKNMVLDWDCSLHLPPWVSKTEKASIEDRLEEWTKELEASGVDIVSLASALDKPLRPLWVSQKTVIWLNEVPDVDSWDFTPIILVSASCSMGAIQQRTTTSEFSWNYISGAGDDEESWARGLTPSLFWKHVYDLIASGPDVCNHKVADIVEKDRVYRSHRGQNAPQISIKPKILSPNNRPTTIENQCMDHDADTRSSAEGGTMSWLGSTNVAVGTSQNASTVHEEIDCILNCSKELVSHSLPDASMYLQLPIVTSKYDRFSLLSHLPSALKFAKLNLSKGKKLLVCCPDGEDISVCVSLAILTSLFDNEGLYNSGKSFTETCISKWDMRKRLVFICKFATNARPSRGNLRQVFNFLNKDGCISSQ